MISPTAESLFAEDARSGVGALGLMQVMPATARQVAREDGLAAFKSSRDLYKPDINLRLGSRYLADLIRRYDGSFVLASAAYNAGPHRVDAWLPERPIAGDVWIENIPFNATRRYVQRVLKHTANFGWRMDGQVVRLSERVHPVVPRSVQTASR